MGPPAGAPGAYDPSPEGQAAAIAHPQQPLSPASSLPPPADKPTWKMIAVALLAGGVILAAVAAAYPQIYYSSNGYVEMGELNADYEVKTSSLLFVHQDGGDIIKFRGTVTKTEFRAGPLVLDNGQIPNSAGLNARDMTTFHFDQTRIVLSVYGDVESQFPSGAKLLIEADVWFVEPDGGQFNQREILVTESDRIHSDAVELPSYAAAAGGGGIVVLGVFLWIKRMPEETARIGRQRQRIEDFNRFKAQVTQRSIDPLFDPELAVAGGSSPLPPPPPPPAR